MSANYIKRVEINKLWGKHDIVWDKLNPDVNILVGINGSGKSTLLRVIYAAIARDEKSIAQCKFESAKIENQNNWHEIKTTSKNKIPVMNSCGAGRVIARAQRWCAMPAACT